MSTTGLSASASSSSFSSRLKKFDAYPKTHEDFRVRTFSGATISILSGAFILFLFFSEFAYYLTTEVHPEVKVDTTRGEKLQINVDMVFPRLPCAYLTLDAMDVAGEQQLDLSHDIFKRRLRSDGTPVDAPVEKDSALGVAKPPPPALSDAAKRAADEAAATGCGSCYGAEERPGQCCNTCEEVREAYRLKGWAFGSPDSIAQCAREGFSDNLRSQRDEGCHVYGSLQVNKVAGHFHVAPGKSFAGHQHVHDMQVYGKDAKFDLSHHINSLSFGKPFPGAVNPLDDVEKVADVASLPAGTSEIYQYFLKIVPTSYENLAGERIDTNQFSVTEHFRPLPPTDHNKPGHEHGLPGVFFMYDMSPIMVSYQERRKSFAHFSHVARRRGRRRVFRRIAARLAHLQRPQVARKEGRTGQIGITN
eukprot:TRINITY_DN5858_c0_g1_i1.p1 TRINITY_DN5858_c0_g1~~TRINITY_DN5858_c0_g1_i1.p1  ORF type:complete len:419 (+),score=181.00 TRINITY_DN5858_c0_g1_i1:121-1377(+)